MTKTTIALAHGDGIGPEIMKATMAIFKAAQVPIETENVEIGQSVYESGHTAGITPQAWETLNRRQVFLKAPITTPQGGGYKSLNVTIRKTLGLFANVRPCRAMAPFVKTKHPLLDLVVVRENEEDLYAGIEHQQTPEVVQCLKLITRPGCERIIRYAFEFARQQGRKKVSCFSKDNIMKLTDGLFHKVFDEIGEQYPELEKDHWIIDIGAARLADTPELFDIIVTPNLYGDIISDITAQISGSVGLGGSANIGENFAMFEAIHGSAPPIAGKDVANPSGLINAAVLMLSHLGLNSYAASIHNAWLRTIEDGIHTMDIFQEGIGQREVGTQDFAAAVMERLGSKPHKLDPSPLDENSRPLQMPAYQKSKRPEKTLLGTDAFICCDNRNPDALAERLVQASEKLGLGLQMITNRGVKVWPKGHPATFCTDHWRCRFMREQQTPAAAQEVIDLLDALHQAGLEVIKTENLYQFDGVNGFSLGQGQ